ncbi:MAG: MFS transporter [Humidesulfovibrio sp.]|uniref:MFS transporter n=1 Tax=Humidesulfovibrio sp. TaxID=2910988 RepID=UPI00273665F1|nr:MFS transporter [Humidesulfovibrio sp.]MDP2847315.1 MFS transporter [Humidesulfovibrio sp.]
MATLDAGIVNTALPTIALGFGASLAQAQWIVAGYFLVISCLLPLFGRMGDMYGRRRLYSIGFIVFTAASLFCGSSPTLWALIAARVGQGVGAAMLMANGPGIIMAAFPGPTRGRALGLTGMTVALGSLAGPGLGGLLIQGFGWRSVFYLNIPIGLLGLFLARRFLPPQERLRDETLDLGGAVLFALGMTGLLLAMSHGHDWGWTSPPVLAGLCVALVAFPGFAAWERRCQHPMLDLSLFRIWPFFSGNVVAFLAFLSMFTNAILLPFYLHGQQGLEPYATGLVLSSLPLTMAVIAPMSGYLSERVNFATLTSIGLGIMSCGLLLLSSLASDSPLWRVYLGQVVLGMGVGMFMSPNNNSVLSSAPQDKVGLVGGVLALVRNVGMVSGIAVAITVFEGFQGMGLRAGETADAAFMTGFHAALTAGAILAAGAGCLSLFRRRLFSAKPAQVHCVVKKDA